ncbi:hypothetical protein BRC73_01690 [Halobacteriales archaeon QH_7_66_37]|nr:MAG: hypothetical protein BRC73_01690 [Halobacteriales archaeon QH_7_66_37]
MVGSATGVGATGFTQHSLGDTMLDLVFNTMGGVVVGSWGTVYPTDLVPVVRERVPSITRSNRVTPGSIGRDPGASSVPVSLLSRAGNPQPCDSRAS